MQYTNRTVIKKKQNASVIIMFFKKTDIKTKKHKSAVILRTTNHTLKTLKAILFYKNYMLGRNKSQYR